MGGIPYARPPYRQEESNIPRLLLEQGRIAGERAQRSADIWGNAIAGLGQQAGQAIEQYAITKRDKAWVSYVQSGEWAKDPKGAYSMALKTWGPKDGPMQFNALMAAGTIGQGKPEEDQKRLGVIIGAMGKMKPGGRAALWPEARAIGQRVFPGYEIPEQYDDSRWEEFDAIGAQLRGEKPGEGFTLSPGQQRFGPDGQPIASVEPAPEKPKRHTVTVPGPGGRPMVKLLTEEELAGGVEAYRAPTQAAQPSFQAKEVLDDEGRPVMANFNAKTGQYVNASTGKPIANPRPVPSAEATKDARKFKQAGPILDAVAELSEKINTGTGAMAKITGAAAKAAAKANLDDNVAEYEALIMGFTPLVARALGHTGVLTEQDVVSVRMLFPRPGDSKSLRDRKVARIKSIVKQLETESAPGGAKGGTVGRFKVEVE